MQANLKTLICIFLISLTIILPCFLQRAEAKPSLTLSFYKDNGYGMGNDIGGLWTVNAAVSSGVAYVEFYLDNQLQVNDTSAPFSWQFKTSDYPTGEHTIKAVAYDTTGDSSIAQAERNFQEASTESVTGMILAVAGIIIAIICIAVGFSLYRAHKTKR